MGREPDLLYLNRLESPNDVVTSAAVDYTPQNPLTEGLHSVKVTTIKNELQSIILANTLSLSSDDFSSVHLSIMPLVVNDAIPVYQVRFKLDDASNAYALSRDNDTYFELEEDLWKDTVTELTISLDYDLDVLLNDRRVTEIAVTFKDNNTSPYIVGLMLDDLYVSDSLGTGLDDLLWVVRKVSDDDYHEYLDPEMTYSDSEGIGISRLDSQDGVLVYGSDVGMLGNTISTGERLNLSESVDVAGSLYAGTMCNGIESLLGRPVSLDTFYDMSEEGTLRYVADATSNLTIDYYNKDGSYSGYSVTSSGLTGDSTGDVVYLNLGDHSQAVSLDVTTLFIGLNITEGELPVTYKFNTSSVARVYEVSPNPMMPLTQYETVDSRSLQLREGGVDEDGYITSWIASPRDTSRSLQVTDGSIVNRLTRSFGVNTPDVTIDFYLWLDLYTNTSPPMPMPVPGSEPEPRAVYYYSSGWTTLIELIDDAPVPDRALSMRVAREYKVVYDWEYDSELDLWYVNGILSTDDNYHFNVRKYESHNGYIPDNVMILAEFIVSSADAHHEWYSWRIDLNQNMVQYQPVDTTPSPTEVQLWPDHELDHLTELSFMEDLPGASGNISYYVDDLHVMTLNRTKSVVHDDFSRGAIADLLVTNWDLEDHDDPHPYYLTTAKDIGYSRSALNIDPVSLSAYNQPSAQLEFLNGWYTPMSYTQAQTEYVSGYNNDLRDDLPTKYYQHYFTILEVTDSALYRLRLSTPLSEFEGVRFSVDGVNMTLDTLNEVQVYLRTGLHPVYIRMYDDGDDVVNGFRLQIRDGDGSLLSTTMRTYVPEHGKMTAIYYDNDHAERLRRDAYAGFYEDSTAPLDKTNIIMLSESIGGLKVTLDAEDLVSYMLRDVNSGGYDSQGHSKTALYETAGSVLFSSDALPDTIFRGEYEGSLVERFLEMNGYVAVDGYMPFCYTTSSDGSGSYWERGATHVLDLEQTDAFYNSDDSTFRYGALDADDSGLFEDSGLGTPDEYWSSSHTYKLGLGWTVDFDWYKPVCLRANGDADNQGLKIGAFETNSTEYRVLLAPGQTKLRFVVSDFRVTDTDVPGSVATDYQANMINLRVDGYYVWDSEKTISTLNGGSDYDVTSSLLSNKVSNDDSDGEYIFEFDLSDFSIFYEAFISEVEFDIIITGENNARGGIRVQGDINGMEIYKQFQVITSEGIDENFAMTLPTPTSGILQDVSLSRALLPWYEDTRDMGRLSPFIEPDWDPIWTDTVDLNIFDGSLNLKNSVILEPSESNPYRKVQSASMSQENLLLTEVDFKDGENVVNELSYRANFSASATPCVTAVRYFWQVKTFYGVHPVENDVKLYAYRHWMPKFTVRAKHTVQYGGEIEPGTPIGRMILGEMSNYTPTYSMDTHYLENMDRRYLEYATWGDGAPIRYASPITFQADPFGGGIVTYGLSQVITNDHIWSNASLSTVYMDYISKVYHMNSWIHTPLKDAVSAVSLNYEVEDRVELWNQEGWLDEYLGSSDRNNLIIDMLDAENDIAERWAGENADLFGNGKLDIFRERTEVDYDGADWFSSDQYDCEDSNEDGVPDGRTVQTMYMNNQTLQVRPSVSETSDWDDENPDYPLRMPGIHWLMAPGSIARHQVLYGEGVDLTFDWSELNITEDIYLQVRFTLGNRLIWVNKTITTEVDHLSLDFAQLNPSGETVLWASDDSGLTTVPTVTVWAYDDDPATTSKDVASIVNNLLYAEMFYLKMAYDQEYISAYMERIEGQSEQAERMKGYMIALGAAMICAAPYTGGVSGIWGIDLIVSTSTGTSMFDHILNAGMGLTNVVTGGRAFDEDYIGNFTLFHLTSERGLDLILSEALADILSLGIHDVGRWMLRRAGGAGSRALTRTASMLGADVSETSTGVIRSVRGARSWF
ncbi:MAG: hypothetical protein RTU92_04320, partial [Candidatus Thorarchaeota archaeon]